jgi:enoyl-CoA hydratase
MARNAMTWAMYDGLAAACAAINENSRVRVAVLRGAGGKAFAAGTDIAQFREFANGDDGAIIDKGSLARHCQLKPSSFVS